MDREIPKEVRNKERNKKIIRYGAIGVAGIVVVSVLISLMRTGVKEKDLVFSKVGKGTIEVSVSASGKVVPAFEEIINSPINTRILEVYRKGGDSVDVGTPILKLDLQSAETDYKKMLDEEQMRSYKLKQLKLDNQTKLTDLQMKIKVSAMKLDRMKVELRNEQYLDSLGSGTTDKVRQAELSYNVAQLEYEQLQQQYANEKEVLAAEYQVQELDFSLQNTKCRNWISACSRRHWPKPNVRSTMRRCVRPGRPSLLISTIRLVPRFLKGPRLPSSPT